MNGNQGNSYFSMATKEMLKLLVEVKEFSPTATKELLQQPRKFGPVWNAGISQESHRNFIGISLISQEKCRNRKKFPHSKQALIRASEFLFQFQGSRVPGSRNLRTDRAVNGIPLSRWIFHGTALINRQKASTTQESLPNVSASACNAATLVWPARDRAAGCMPPYTTQSAAVGSYQVLLLRILL